jgi:Prokaryotic N-terminal methylation motif
VKRPLPDCPLPIEARRLRLSPLAPRPCGLRSSAFTLIEILVTVSLLAFIILGLYAMFTQVQRAFKMSMTQVDLLEAGRAVTETLPRELEQMAACNGLYPSFCVQCPAASIPLSSPLPGTATLRINLLQDTFFVMRQNQSWVGIGYCVRVPDPTDPTGRRLVLPQVGATNAVGSLYRYSATTNAICFDPSASIGSGNPRLQDALPLYDAFRRACVSGSAESANISNRICDGVIHFHFRAFATNGAPIFSYGSQNPGRAFYRTNFLGNAPVYPYFGSVPMASTIPNTSGTPYPDNAAGLYFYSNALPAALEMELGILDQHSWERYNSIAAPAARLAYLQRPEVTSRIQLFRQRIPIRNVDPLAYQ